MKHLAFLLMIFCLCNASAQQLKSEKLLEDFDYLVEELRAKHQGLYQYTQKEVVDKKMDSIRNTLKSPSTKLDFYKTLGYTIGLTNEGHTSISLNNWAMLKIGLSKSFLPVGVKLLDEGLIITQYFGKDLKEINKGAKIISINGRKTDAILNDLFPLIPTDGFNQTSKKEWISGVTFAMLYRLVYGKEKVYHLQIREYGSDKTKMLSIPAIRYTRFKNKHATLPSTQFDYTQFIFKKINDSIGYLSIPSFGADGDYEDFYKTSFSKIDSLGLQHLIIDIQSNGGGTEGNENLLFSYLTDARVKKYKQVTMFPEPYEKSKHNKGYLFDKWRLDKELAKRGEFTLYSDYYSDLGYSRPPEDLIYQGKVYVLTSGRTFSGGAEFASLIKMTNRGLFIGEETGGAYEGNVSGYSRTIKLPNTKLKVKIPMVHFQINVQPEKRGRGIIPDYHLPQTWEDYMNGTNTKKEFALKLIQKDL